MWTFFLWTFAAFAAAIYCLTKAVIDLRSRKYISGVIGLASAVVFLLTPTQVTTQPVKIDLPA
ncbi:hypothetical protein D9601_11160 [Sphingomonas sp. MA1305]|uniref:hypothetical protein n=1 Tax=Sphingomonas sp. MA1305 TaxID=2479204 RepID=UPI0018DEF297|nr:hypothetical protein [Sphingomonas sp. MA1305]MBI0475910.1 hypothetical protein [Sphingomonas sp. MA1305]